MKDGIIVSSPRVCTLKAEGWALMMLLKWYSLGEASFFLLLFLWCRLFTTIHTCLFRDSSWHTGSVCTASRRWCYRIVMETKMQKWHNRKIHDDVLWRGWHFWRWKFDNPRDRTTDSKIKCRKNVRVPGKLFPFLPSCCNRTWNWFTEYDCWFIDELTSSSSAAAAASAPASVSLCIHIAPAKLWTATYRLADWRLSNWANRAVLGRTPGRLTGYLFQASTALELFRAWFLVG